MTVASFVFIRAINTGSRRLTNAEQLAPFVEAGYSDATAYQAAGNIVVRGTAATDELDLDRRLAAAYGFEVTTFVRTTEQVRSTVEGQPFEEPQISRTAGRIQVGLLRSEPPPSTIAHVHALVPEDDTVVFSGREWYWLPLDGVSTSSLPVAAIERLVGPMTMRTLGTLARMLRKFG